MNSILNQDSLLEPKRGMRLRTKLIAFVGAALVATLSVGVMAFLGMVNSSKAVNQAFVAKDLTADILPPPLYLIEMRLVLSQAIEGSLTLDQARNEVKRLEGEFQDRAVFWKKTPVLGDGNRQLEAQQKDGVAFIASVQQALDLLGKGEKSDVLRAALNDSHKTYLSHRAGVDATVKEAAALAETSIAGYQSQSKTMRYGQGIAVFLAMGFLVAFGLWIGRSIWATVGGEPANVAEHARAVASGDLTKQIKLQPGDQLSIAAALRDMQISLSKMVADMRSSSAFVAYSGVQLVANSHDLSERTQQQAENLQETAASVEQLSSAVQGNANHARQAATQANEVRESANQSAKEMVSAIASVEAIQSSAKRMDEIVGVINGLAFQTNILALNAAVEAARAGESGRGFAVVASEVRSLAQRSAESAKEIRQLIGTSTQLVTSGAAQIRQAGESIQNIVAGISVLATNMSQISNSNTEQSSGLMEITSAVQQLDTITQENMQMVERTEEQAVALEGRATSMADFVSFFKLNQGAPEEAIALAERAAARYRGKGDIHAYLHELTDPSQQFYEKDMYVFVLDQKGEYVAFGGKPDKVGTRVQDISGVDGDGLLDAIVTQSKQGPGWVEYDITNPANGFIQTKMSYVRQIADNLFLGCGVYRNFANA